MTAKLGDCFRPNHLIMNWKVIKSSSSWLRKLAQLSQYEAETCGLNLCKLIDMLHKEENYPDIETVVWQIREQVWHENILRLSLQVTRNME